MSLRRHPMDGGEGGGAGSDPPKPESKPASDPPKPQGDPEALGDAGKRALDSVRAEEAAARATARAEKKRADDAEAKLAELVEAGATDQEKELTAARKDAAKEATEATAAGYQQRILESEVLAAATGKLTTPSDAIGLLDLDQFDADEDVDKLRTALGTAIDALVKERPYLRSGKVEGEGDGGAKPPAKTDDKNLTASQRMARGYGTNTKKKQPAA